MNSDARKEELNGLVSGLMAAGVEYDQRNFGLNRLLTDEQYAEMRRSDDEIPAVGPDYPAPLTGPLARQSIEDQITESDHRDSRDLEIFILGALAGACWAALAALAIL